MGGAPRAEAARRYAGASQLTEESARCLVVAKRPIGVATFPRSEYRHAILHSSTCQLVNLSTCQLVNLSTYLDLTSSTALHPGRPLHPSRKLPAAQSADYCHGSQSFVSSVVTSCSGAQNRPQSCSPPTLSWVQRRARCCRDKLARLRPRRTPERRHSYELWPD